MPLSDLQEENLEYLKTGFKNLRIHIENMKKFGKNIVVAINKFATDTDNEVKLLKELTEKADAKAIETSVFSDGGSGAIELANYVVELCEKENEFKFLYDTSLSIKEKIEIICKEIYRAKDVVYTDKANKEIKRIESLSYSNLPICIAKTPYSLSDDPNVKITDENYKITIRDMRINAGAGFLVAYTANILTMPGLPKSPMAYKIDLDSENNIVGLS